MRLERLTLQHFRNYEGLTFSPSPAVSLLLGDNAQGKTNVMEAVHLLSTMKLFRTAQKKEGIAFGKASASVQGTFEAEGMAHTLCITLSQTKPMQVLRNGSAIKRQKDGVGLLKTVLFCPEDLTLVRDGASVRRKHIDRAICQLRPAYAEQITRYQKLLEHKTKLLKEAEAKPSLAPLWQDFTWQMCVQGAQIAKRRAKYTQLLQEQAQTFHHAMAPNETLGIAYQTLVPDPFAGTQEMAGELFLHAQRHKSAEFASRQCLSGVHKDDWCMTINGQEAAAFASQGQTRTMVLALKLAERKVIWQDTGEVPVLLLDDVLSELDEKRQGFLLSCLNEGQTILTGCDPRAQEMVPHVQVYNVQGGTIEG